MSATIWLMIFAVRESFLSLSEDVYCILCQVSLVGALAFGLI